MSTVLREFSSLTSDLGTEAGFMDYHATSWKSLMPAWMGLGQDGLLEDAGALQFEDVDAIPLFSEGFVVPGLLHIVNNATFEVAFSMTGWQDWLAGLRAVVGLLSEQDNRQRFVATCVSGTQHANLERMFSTNLPSIIDWRWSVISKVPEPLLDLNVPLRVTWSARKFMNLSSEPNANPADGNQIAEEGLAGSKSRTQRTSDVNAKAVTKTIHCNYWWQFAEMCLVFHRICDNLTAWAERCACHDIAPDCCSQMKILCSEFGLPKQADGRIPCMMSGHRAPEMATGRLMQFFEEIWKNNFDELLVNCSVGLTSEEFDALVANLGQAKSHITRVLAQKCSFWDQLPWKLAGLAHFDPTYVRDTALRVIAKFDASPQEELLHHPLTWSFMQRGSTRRSQVEALASGTYRALLEPSFVEKVQDFMLIPIVERIVERDHCTVHKEIATRKVGGPYVSCGLRLPQLEQTINMSRQDHDSFISCLQMTRLWKAMPKLLGMSSHPALQPLASGGKSGFADLSKIVYGLDLLSQYSANPAARKVHARNKARIVLSYQCLNPQVKRPLTIESVIDAAAEDHCRKRSRINAVYSLPQCISLVPLQSTLANGQQSQGLPAAPEAAALEPDVLDDDLGPQQPAAEGQTFIRVVSATPSRARTVYQAPASGAKLRQDRVVVTVHREQGNRESPIVDFEPGSATGVCPLATMSIRDLVSHRKQIIEHAPEQKLQYSLPGLADPASTNLITRMVAAKAFETSQDGSAFAVPSSANEDLQMLANLEQAGFAVRCQGASSTWQLSVKSLQTLQVFCQLDSGCQFFHKRAPSAIEDMTDYELVSQVLEGGWAWKRVQNKQLASQEPFVLGGPLMFYSSSVKLSSAYMKALLSMERLHLHDIQEIPHGKTDSFYSGLLRGVKPRQRPTFALEDDMEEDARSLAGDGAGQSLGVEHREEQEATSLTKMHGN